VNRAGPSVVKIVTSQGLGSGVIMTANGYIVTNNHVVSGSQKVDVTLANGSTLGGKVVGTDPSDDLAVVKINATKLPAATFGDSSKLAVGQTVLAIGNPLGITRTVTEGIVSALNRTVREGQGGGLVRNAVQTSAPINPGNSGGALVNLGAQVIGIPTLTAIDPEFNAPAGGIGFAIPSNVVVFIASQIIKNGKVTHTGRAALGVSVTTVTPQLASQYSLPIDHGVLIAQVLPHEAAARAGMTAGEVIVKVDGRPISTEEDLLDALVSHKPGDTITVTAVTPKGEQHSYQVTLGEFPANSNG
jgi:S1-C subfamily serine protease